jgi:hypothetical protein
MRTLALCIAALIGLPCVANAQVAVDIHFDLPVVLPRPVVVSPGVQVIPEVREEVFFDGGWYWVRRDDVWYRSRDHRGGWMMVPPRRVPPRLVALPPGKYRNWKAEKEERKAERKAERREEKRERREEREHGHGHGHGHGNGQGQDD